MTNADVTTVVADNDAMELQILLASYDAAVAALPDAQLKARRKSKNPNDLAHGLLKAAEDAVLEARERVEQNIASNKPQRPRRKCTNHTSSSTYRLLEKDGEEKEEEEEVEVEEEVEEESEAEDEVDNYGHFEDFNDSNETENWAIAKDQEKSTVGKTMRNIPYYLLTSYIPLLRPSLLLSLKQSYLYPVKSLLSTTNTITFQSLIPPPVNR